MEPLLLIAILGELSGAEMGLTVGQLHKRCAKMGFAKSKIARLLQKMGEGGLVGYVSFDYRPNVVSKRYYIMEGVVRDLEVIVEKYAAACKQEKLWD